MTVQYGVAECVRSHSWDVYQASALYKHLLLRLLLIVVSDTEQLDVGNISSGLYSRPNQTPQWPVLYGVALIPLPPHITGHNKLYPSGHLRLHIFSLLYSSVIQDGKI